jgi:hypothetical protein
MSLSFLHSSPSRQRKGAMPGSGQSTVRTTFPAPDFWEWAVDASSSG